ncbi:MAG: serine hydrolase [Ignavibacteriales bacterium]|nr:serine hydrolase [Ignavibacteriales bacterium]
MKNFFFLLFSLQISFSQNTFIPSDLQLDKSLSAAMMKIAVDLGIDKEFNTEEDGPEKISFAVIDLNKKNPGIGGVYFDNFIYPASVYKMYVAAEVLRQISQGKYSLTTAVAVKSPNDVDKSSEISWDPRPLLRDGDTVTVGYLLDLMITRSDNSAANCLIDLARRENINELMHQYHWEGSEVTRKYLSRKFEDSSYVKIRSTETCALHAADFMYRIYTNQLVNPWVSQQMKSFLGRQLDTTKLQPGLPLNAMFYHKTGWYSDWTHDVGIVDDGNIRYVIACFLPIEEGKARPIMKELSKRVFEYFGATKK